MVIDQFNQSNKTVVNLFRLAHHRSALRDFFRSISWPTLQLYKGIFQATCFPRFGKIYLQPLWKWHSFYFAAWWQQIMQTPVIISKCWIFSQHSSWELVLLLNAAGTLRWPEYSIFNICREIEDFLVNMKCKYPKP